MATFTSTQRFVKLTNYLLLEYEYATAPNPEQYYVNTGNPTIGYEKIVNGYFNNIQILNRPQDGLITNNIRDLSAIQVEKNRFVTLDNDRLIPYLNSDSKLTSVSNLPVVFPSNIGVYYDTIKLHIISGYSFDNLDGVILQIAFQERTNKKCIISQCVILKGDIELPILNPNPIYLGGGLYDHYVQIKIPSYSNMCYEFDQESGSPTQANTLAAKISSDGNGFLRDAPIEFCLYEINQTSIKNGYQNYIAQIKSQLAILPKDNYSGLASVIQENSIYNYIEYYPSWEGNFLEDFIYAEGRVGNSYYVVNEIELKEQVGLSYITTHNFTSTQSSDFNSPYIFRPVLVNPLTTSFIVNYTMRLVNRSNQNQIIRRSSFSSYDITKYGRENNNIVLSSGVYSHKVYNKITQAANVLSPVGVSPSSKPIEKKIPVFYKDNLISITKENLIIDNSGNIISENTTSGSIQIYGQGKATILIDPFDNFYKFTVYNRVSNSLQILDLGTSLSYYMVFLDKSGQSVRVENIKNRTSISNPVAGQIAFKLIQTNSKKVLGFTDKTFYIVSVTPDSTETKLYSGTWQNHAEYLASNPTGTTGGKDMPGTISTTGSTIIVPKLTGVQSPTATMPSGTQIESNVPKSTVSTIATPYVIGSSSVISIKPTIQVNTTGATGASNTSQSSNQTNIINIPALADSINGKELQGTSIQNVINYYFTPGAPGAILFKGIKPSQFLTAALQIHPKSESGVFDLKYTKYCNILGFPVVDDPSAEDIKKIKGGRIS